MKSGYNICCIDAIGTFWKAMSYFGTSLALNQYMNMSRPSLNERVPACFIAIGLVFLSC